MGGSTFRRVGVGPAVLLTAAMIDGAAAAADPAAEAKRGMPEAAAFDQAITANKVAEFGRREHDPHALLIAARMLQEVPFVDQGPSADAAEAAAFSPEGLFAEAKAMASGDPQLLTEINLAQSSGSRGVVSSAFGRGLVRNVEAVAARSTYAFVLKASGGDLLRIGAIGDVGAKMVIRLLDQSGKVVCVDDNADYAPVCAASPRVTSLFRVEIQNHSASPTRAVILSN